MLARNFLQKTPKKSERSVKNRDFFEDVVEKLHFCGAGFGLLFLIFESLMWRFWSQKRGFEGVFSKKMHFFQKKLQKCLENKKFVVPLHSQSKRLHS